MTTFPILNGFMIGAGMIIPIGVQNSYVLNQGIKRNFHFIAASICILCDFILMTAGVFGGGALLASNALLLNIVTWLGIAFLTGYGAMFFKSFLYDSQQDKDEVELLRTRKAVILTTLAVTLLNPHVYLDTIMIIGSISSQYPDEDKLGFLIGIALASLVWFYSLSFAAAKMAPWLSQNHVQRVINLIVALIMWFIAISLLSNV